MADRAKRTLFVHFTHLAGHSPRRKEEQAIAHPPHDRSPLRRAARTFAAVSGLAPLSPLITRVSKLGSMPASSASSRADPGAVATARRMALDYLAAYRSLMEAAEPRIKLVSSAE